MLGFNRLEPKYSLVLEPGEISSCRTEFLLFIIIKTVRLPSNSYYGHPSLDDGSSFIYIYICIYYA